MDRIDADQNVSIATLAHAPGAHRWRTEAMRSHVHARLIHVTKGQGRMTIAGLTTGYGPNNLIYIPPHTMYGMEAGPTVFAQILTLPAPADWPAKPFHLRLVDVARQAELTGQIDAIERELKPGGHPRAAACRCAAGRPLHGIDRSGCSASAQRGGLCRRSRRHPDPPDTVLPQDLRSLRPVAIERTAA